MMKKIFLLAIVILSMLQVCAASDSQLITLSLVNQDPDPATSGDIVEIRIGVENRGGEPAENMMLEFIPSYPFSAVSGESVMQEVGTIGAYKYDNDMKIVKFKIRVDRDATAGQYDFKIREYKDQFKEIYVDQSFSIDVESRQSAEVIYIDQVELIPGKITPMIFTVNNVGSSPLRELTFQWENEDDIILPVGSDNTKYIKYIDVGSSAEMKFDVIASANADPDLYKLDLTLTYNDPVTGEETKISTKAGVYVGGATDFDAAFSGVSSGEASFSISNIGSVSASSVTVQIPNQPGWRVQGTNSVIIGNLNEGDYTIASFNLQQAMQRNASSSGFQRPSTQDAAVLVHIIYTDSRGNRNTIVKEVPVDQSAFVSSAISSTAATGTTFPNGVRRRSTTSNLWGTVKWYIIAAVLLVFLIVLRKRYKKEKFKNPKYTCKMLFKDMFKKKKKG
ncbi:MAG: COG1361 S-layer family protein [Nanoarchaeota archaeon]|nr:COG1361 S-layer family protein [Nanoarchaeota archaeon]MBU1704382.1 COG1361 S-layer family protein [Nanoarchaeota archaeon]